MALPAIVQWCTSGTRTEPSAGEKATGWLLGRKPPAEYFNWIQGTLGEWTVFLTDVFANTGGTPTEGVAGLTLGTSGGLYVTNYDGIEHRITHLDDGGGEPILSLHDLEVDNVIKGSIEVVDAIVAGGNVTANDVKALGRLESSGQLLLDLLSLSESITGGHKRLTVADASLTLPSELSVDYLRPGASQPAAATDFTTTLSQSNLVKVAGYFEWDGATFWTAVTEYNVASVQLVGGSDLVINLKDAITAPLALTINVVDSTSGAPATDIWKQLHYRINQTSPTQLTCRFYNHMGVLLTPVQIPTNGAVYILGL